MWFYGYFTNEYSVNCTNFCEEIHGNSDNSDVIVLLKTEHFICLKEQHGETKKTIQNSVILLKYKVYSSRHSASEFSMIEVPDFIDESRGMTRFQCQHHQVPSTLIPGTGTHTVVLFVAELQHIVVLGVEVEPFG